MSIIFSINYLCIFLSLQTNIYRDWMCLHILNSLVQLCIATKYRSKNRYAIKWEMSTKVQEWCKWSSLQKYSSSFCVTWSLRLFSLYLMHLRTSVCCRCDPAFLAWSRRFLKSNTVALLNFITSFQWEKIQKDQRGRNWWKKSLQEKEKKKENKYQKLRRMKKK